MEENNLNIPPTEEPIAKKISRIASQIVIPLLLPASTFFIGWLMERRVSNAKQKPLKESGQMTSYQRKLAIKEIQQQEENTSERMLMELDKLKPLLEQRQQIFCSTFTSRENRFPIEKKLKDLTYSNSSDKKLGLYRGMQDILRNDNHCGDSSHDGGRQGCLMWVYMDYWTALVQLMKYKNIYDRVKKLDET